ncbi:MAG: HlyC/CorC family transporter [Treponema sp.]|nr:HlyC/CorC family transporter [Treponema sp.]
MIYNIAICACIALIIFGVAFFTSSETAYLSLPKLKVRNMLSEKKPHAKTVARLKENMDRLLTVVLIGTNLLNSLATALATAFAISAFGSRGATYAPLAMSLFCTVFGQIIPKTAAGLYPERFASFSALPLLTLETLFYPVVRLFESLSRALVKIVEKIMKPTGALLTEEELKTLIDVGANEGTIEKDESYLLNKIIKFNNLSASDIMKHRSFVRMISEDADYEQVIHEFMTSGFATLTVYKGSRENVTGILNYRTVLFDADLEDLGQGYAGRKKEPVLFVPGTFSVLEVLNKFRRDENKFAVVLNEQGETSGIITMEDITRVVFGRMTDENSSDHTAPEDKIKLISVNTFIVPGDMKIDDLNEVLDLHLESEEMNTIGGWLLEQLGYLPSAGTVLIKDKNLFTAEDVAMRRIVSVKIKIQGSRG